MLLGHCKPFRVWVTTKGFRNPLQTHPSDLFVHRVNLIVPRQEGGNVSYILWDLAKTSKGQIVWISEKYNDELYCVECDGKMIPVKGEIKRHHFRHSVESNCSGESARHWSKKYQIHDIAKQFGNSEVEKGVDKYVADILFEQEWPFEVVISNPPSDEKFADLKERLVIFDFTDMNWIDDNELCGESLDELVEQISTSIIEGDTAARDFPVCTECRRVKGVYSRIKTGLICPNCDYRQFMAKDT